MKSSKSGIIPSGMRNAKRSTTLIRISVLIKALAFTLLLAAAPTSAQYYGYGYDYYGNSGYYGGNSYWSGGGGYQDQQEPSYGYGSYYYSPEAQGGSSDEGGLSSSTPIQIWLSSRYGRFGGYEFYALGGRRSHPTPTGRFTVRAKHEDFYSRKYKAPMPLSLFFTDQCAIHVGSLNVSSHGCIHVDWQAAQTLFQYAKPGKTPVYVYD